MTSNDPAQPNTPQGAPSYLIIGAAKCATTWLQACLNDHPGAYCPPGEPHYFSYDFNPDDPLPRSYLDRFADAKPGQVIGENSNTYLPHPGCARRIEQTLPNARLVISLRDPVSRAYSDYAMRIRQQGKLSDMFRFIDPDHAPDYWFLHKGLYHQQITHWLEHFPREQVLILIADDYKTDAQNQFAMLCRHIGIDDGFVPPSLTAKVNTKDQRLVFPRLRRQLRGNPLGRKLDDALRGSGLKAMVRGLFGKNAKAQPFDDDTKQKLRDFYREDVTKLSELLDRDLTSWVKP